MIVSSRHYVITDMIAFLLAPLFVWMEFLFLFGYRPRLQERLDKKAAKAIAEWRKSKEQKAKKSASSKKNK
jgi:uncharacterized membrane protein YGL010W